MCGYGPLGWWPLVIERFRHIDREPIRLSFCSNSASVESHLHIQHTRPPGPAAILQTTSQETGTDSGPLGRFILYGFPKRDWSDVKNDGGGPSRTLAIAVAES
jgi:hypothetical protein